MQKLSFVFYLQLMLCYSSLHAAPIIDPIADYRFDSCDISTQIEDTKGSFNAIASPSTSTSAATAISGSRALDLSTTDTSDWVTLPKNLINGLNDFSFSVWIKTGTETKQQEIFHALGSGTRDDELEIYIKEDEKVIVKMFDSNIELETDDVELTDNNWHHLAITRKGRRVCLYVDGKQSECENKGKTGRLSVTHTNSVVIGQEQDKLRSSANSNSGFNSSQSFKGYMDELKIYNQMLNPAQITTLYNNEVSGKNYDGSTRTASICDGGGGNDSCETVEDNFSRQSYANNHGSQSWKTIWQESGESDGVRIGKAQVSNRNCTAGYCLRMGTPADVSTSKYKNIGVSREADIDDARSAILSFNYYTGFLKANGTVTLSVSKDGGKKWKNLKTYRISSTNFRANPESFDITAYASENTRIRFLASGTPKSKTGMYIDDIKIKYCPAGGGGDTPATNFNCVEPGNNGITGKLYSKTTSQPFKFDVIALKDANTVENSFASGTDHNISVELVNTLSGGNSCITYKPLTPAISQELKFTASDAGRKTSNIMNSSRAYSAVKCRMTDNTDNPAVIGCSTDSFAIRPTTISLSSNMTNTGATGLPKTTAGSVFTLTATSVAGYTGTPAIDNTKLSAHTGANQTGQISGSFNAANSNTGIASGTNFTYSEVGNVKFLPQAVYDQNYTQVDQNGDCLLNYSNTPDSNGKIGCYFGNTADSAYFGRFTPDHFKITAQQNGSFANSCGSFTYNGQNFNYQTTPTLTVTAYNGLTPATATQNYTGSYAPLVATDFNVTVPSSDAIQLGADAVNKINLNWTPGSATLTDNTDGSLIFSFGDDSYNYLHEQNSKIAPFSAQVNLEFSDISDSDGVATENLPHTLQATGTSIRFGRIKLDNAHGSEIMPLAVPLYSEYFNGSHFINNTDDNCSSIAVSQLTFNDAPSPISFGSGSSTASIANSPFVQGQAGLSLSSPGAGNTGSVIIKSADLISAYPWLLYDWDGDGDHDDAPKARATFGIYKGNSRQIYFKEVY